MTHSFNTGQRFNRLSSQATAGGLNVTPPATPHVCPPGHYMMFLINLAGVPSVAKIMQVTAPVAAAAAALPRVVSVSAPSPGAPAPRDVFGWHDDVIRAAKGTKVVVGLTGTCPYGISACWGGANEALAHLDGVELVDPIPDGPASTGTVFLADDGLPSLDRWRDQFSSIVNESYTIRGIEVTLTGTIEVRDEVLILIGSKVRPPVRLVPLNPADKVQWDRPARAPQPALPDEAAAYARLATHLRGAGAEPVTITGPLLQAGDAFTLEVREVGR